MEKEIHNCPTCGSEVIVEGNTTKYYVPISKVKHPDRKVLRRISGSIWADEHNTAYREDNSGCLIPITNIEP